MKTPGAMSQNEVMILMTFSLFSRNALPSMKAEVASSTFSLEWQKENDKKMNDLCECAPGARNWLEMVDELA